MKFKTETSIITTKIKIDNKFASWIYSLIEKWCTLEFEVKEIKFKGLRIMKGKISHQKLLLAAEGPKTFAEFDIFTKNDSDAIYRLLNAKYIQRVKTINPRTNRVASSYTITELGYEKLQNLK